MANRYWVGGTNTWNSTAGTKWATTSGGAGGASVPTTADDVFFDANSGAGVVTTSGSINAKSVTCTGFTGTLTGSGALTVAGNFTLVSGMGVGLTGSLTFTDTGTLTSAGKTLNGVELTINGAGITVTLGDALNLNNASITVTQGTFTTNNFNVTAGSFSSSGTGTRAVNLGSSTVTLKDAAPVYIWDTNPATNLTFNAGTSTVVISPSGSAAINGANGLTFYNVTFTNTATAGYSAEILGALSFNTLTVTAPSTAGINNVTFTANQTISTFVCAGASAVRRLWLRSSTFASPITLSITTWSSIVDVDFRDISLNSTRSGTRLGDCGGNTNVTFPAAKTVYWNLSGTQSWSATGWATSSGGSPAVDNFPLAQDTAVFDNTGLAGTVTLDQSWNVGTVDMSGRTNALTFSITPTLNIYKDFSLGSGITVSGAGSLSFSGRSVTQTVTTAGRTLSTTLAVLCQGGTVLLADAYTATAGISVERGTFDTNNQAVTVTGSGISATASSSKTLTIGSSLITISGGGFSVAAPVTITPATGTIRFTGASSKAFAGGGQNFSGITVDQGGPGILVISGNNTIGDITNTYSASGATTIRLTAGSTNTFLNWNANGAFGRLLTIDSTTSGVRATLSKASGTVSANYLSIKDSNATGGATWAALYSTNVGNNIGWIFVSGGNFLAFF